MPTRRHIKYRAETFPPYDSVRVRILEQTHITVNFNSDGTIFKHGDCRLVSLARPAAARNGYVFWLRGSARSYDFETLELSLETYAKFKAAVQAYNEAHKG